MKELQLMVKDIWKKYDRDGNGILDKDEVKSFVTDILNDITLEQKSPGADSGDSLDVSDIFDQIDKDGNGCVEIEEMTNFLLKVSGFTFIIR